jgi:signal transduction histidine kinase
LLHKNTKYLLGLVYLLAITQLRAQNNYVDSLKNWVATHPHAQYDSLRMVNYHRISYRLSEVNPIEAWKYAYEVDKLAQKTKIKIGHAMSRINFGILERLDGNYDNSQEHYLSAIKIAEKNNWKRGLSICLNNIGEGYKELGQYNECIDFTKRAVALNTATDQKRGLANNYEILGDAYFLSGRYALAIEYLNKGFAMAQQADDNYQIIGKLLNDLGKVYNAQKKYKLAEKYFNQAANLNTIHNEKLQLITTYVEHGKSYRNQAEFDRAIRYLKRGLKVSEDISFLKAKSEIFRELSFTYELMNNHRAALENFQKHKNIDDQVAIRKITTRNEVMRLRINSYYIDKENTQLKEIKEQQEKEIRNKAIWISLLASSFLLSIIGAYYFYNRQRIKDLQLIQAAQAETIRQMKISEQIRTQLARDLHDDMGSTLSSISILSQVAEKQADKTNQNTVDLLVKINQNSQRMLDTMNDIVWTTQPVNDTLESITVKIREFAAEMFDARDINYKIEIDEDLQYHKLPANQVYNFYLIIKEAINNIAKYANAQNVVVTILKKLNNISLSIIDDGQGFDISSVRNGGNGLKNMHKRANDLGGVLSINSKPNQGTKLEFELKTN